MILAAGRGLRMRELTNSIPKPLLKVNGFSLIEHRLFALHKAGIKEVIINVSYLAEKIQQLLGDGSRYGVSIYYSVEQERLETGGGIKNALPLLGDAPFLLTNSDIYTDYPYENLINKSVEQAHVVLVDNPKHVPTGDFSLQEDRVIPKETSSYTYSGIAVFHPKVFAEFTEQAFPLLKVFSLLIKRKSLTGEYYKGFWQDIGRPEDYLVYQQS